MTECNICGGEGYIQTAQFGLEVCDKCDGKGELEDTGKSNTHPDPKSPLPCVIHFKGGQKKVVGIPRNAPKIERENAWAMTRGYLKPEGRFYVSIFTSGENGKIREEGFDKVGKYTPRVLSFNSTKDKDFPVSQTGFEMGVSDYTKQFPVAHRYIAILDRIFFIDKRFHDNQGMELWEELCGNGVFDIWRPKAPYNRERGEFNEERGGRRPIYEPQILLLRVYQLGRPLHVEHRKTYTDRVRDITGLAPLTLKRPIIPYDTDDRFYNDFEGKYTFVDIGDRIEKTMEKFGILNEKIINDTSKIEILE